MSGCSDPEEPVVRAVRHGSLVSRTELHLVVAVEGERTGSGRRVRAPDTVTSGLVVQGCRRTPGELPGVPDGTLGQRRPTISDTSYAVVAARRTSWWHARPTGSPLGDRAGHGCGQPQPRGPASPSRVSSGTGGASPTSEPQPAEQHPSPTAARANIPRPSSHPGSSPAEDLAPHPERDQRVEQRCRGTGAAPAPRLVASPPATSPHDGYGGSSSGRRRTRAGGGCPRGRVQESQGVR